MSKHNSLIIDGNTGSADVSAGIVGGKKSDASNGCQKDDKPNGSW